MLFNRVYGKCQLEQYKQVIIPDRSYQDESQ